MASAGVSKPKVLVVGPTRSHKTSLVNYLAGLAESFRGNATSPALTPTVGVRVLDVDTSSGTVEVWDVSGDQSYEATWPAVCDGAAAVLLVYDPTNPGAAVSASPCELHSLPRARVCVRTSHHGLANLRVQKELELWHEWFVTRLELPFDRVMVLGLTVPDAPGAPATKIGTSTSILAVQGAT